MELGYDAVLLNTAVAKAGDPAAMARAHGAGGRGGADGVSRWTDGAARHGRALDAGARPGEPVVSAGLDPFYPIVDSAAWVARVVGVGARLIQLRVKDRHEAEIAGEIAAALDICRKRGRDVGRQ